MDKNHEFFQVDYTNISVFVNVKKIKEYYFFVAQETILPNQDIHNFISEISVDYQSKDLDQKFREIYKEGIIKRNEKGIRTHNHQFERRIPL